MTLRIFIALLFLVAPIGADAAQFDHDKWNRLLERFVSPTESGHSTTVDYAGMKENRAALRRYLEQLASVERDTFEGWSEPQRLAFLINAYNAWTVELILADYPGIESIKDIGGWFGSPWKQPIAPLLGRTRTLDEIEHEMIRGTDWFKEPRIHFAVNCASIGCPALRTEAYVAERLDPQLEDQTRRFLADRSRNDWRDGVLYISPLFKWYREDFAMGWRGADSVRSFLSQYTDTLGLSAEQETALQAGRVDLRYTEYDWRLNDAESSNQP